MVTGLDVVQNQRVGALAGPIASSPPVCTGMGNGRLPLHSHRPSPPPPSPFHFRGSMLGFWLNTVT